MSVALKNCVRVSVLALVVAGLSGCGTENPMGPSAAAVAPTTVELSNSVAPIDELPAPGDGSETATLIENTGGSNVSGKTIWSERPGRRLGWGRNK